MRLIAGVHHALLEGFRFAVNCQAEYIKLEAAAADSPHRLEENVDAFLARQPPHEGDADILISPSRFGRMIQLSRVAQRMTRDRQLRFVRTISQQQIVNPVADRDDCVSFLEQTLQSVVV